MWYFFPSFGLSLGHWASLMPESTSHCLMDVVTIKLLLILMQRTFVWLLDGQFACECPSICTYAHISYREILWTAKEWISAYTGMCADVNVVLLIRQTTSMFKQLWTIISTVKHDLTTTATILTGTLMSHTWVVFLHYRNGNVWELCFW